MVKINFLILSEDSIIEKDTNTLTIIKTLNKLSVPSGSTAPFIIPRMAISVGYSGDVGKYEGGISMKDHKGKDIFEKIFEVNIPPENPRYQYSLKVIGVSLDELGEYTVETFIDSKRAEQSFVIGEK